MLRLVWQETVMAARSNPPTAPPAPLKAFLQHTKTPFKKILATLDADSDFRAAMLEAEPITESEVGEIGWNWLTRPPGWEQAQQRMLTDQQRAATAERLQREEQRRLAAATSNLKRRTAATEKAKAALSRAESDQRKKQRDANAARAALDDAVARLQEARDNKDAADATAQRTQRLVRTAKDATAQKLRKLRDAKAKLTQAKKELAAAQKPENGSGSAAAPKPKPKPPGGGRQSRPTVPVQRPIRMPKGVRVGTVEASRHLFAQRHVVVLLDGYNLAFLQWPPDPNREAPDGAAPRIEVASREMQNLRARMERRCRNFAALHRHLEVVLVWDGKSPRRQGRPDHRPGGLSVTFSSKDENADDLIAEYCASLNHQRCAVVVTNDKGLASRTRAAACNVVSSDVFWEAWITPPAPRSTPTSPPASPTTPAAENPS